MDNEENKLLIIWKKVFVFFKGIKQKPSSVVLLFLTILLSLPYFQSWSDSHHVAYVFFLIILLIVFLWDIYGQGDTIGKLESDKKDLQQKNEIMMQSLDGLPKDFLELVFEELSFNSNERISLYTHRNNRFVIAARYASVKPLITKGRESYPENEGYIGKAWKSPNTEDYFYKCDLPSSEKKEYIEKMVKDANLSKETIEKMSMHSRCYYIKVVRKHNEPVGVIVLESLKPRFSITKDEITAILNGMSGRHLAALIDVNEKANGDRNGGIQDEK